ncbi:unnamed protein product [Caretta caretta]
MEPCAGPGAQPRLSRAPPRRNTRAALLRGRGQPVVHGAPCGGCQGEAAAASRVANDPARPGAARFSRLGRGTSSSHTPPPRPASAEPHLPGGPLCKEGLGCFSHLAARQYLILNTAERNY